MAHTITNFQQNEIGLHKQKNLSNEKKCDICKIMLAGYLTFNFIIVKLSNY